MFIFSDPGNFVKKVSALFRPRIQNEINLALLHNGVCGYTNSGVHKEFSNIAEQTRAVVNQVATFTFSCQLAVISISGDSSASRPSVLANWRDTFDLWGGFEICAAVEEQILHVATT